jgi:hypothetical protein
VSTRWRLVVLVYLLGLAAGVPAWLRVWPSTWNDQVLGACAVAPAASMLLGLCVLATGQTWLTPWYALGIGFGYYLVLFQSFVLLLARSQTGSDALVNITLSIELAAGPGVAASAIAVALRRQPHDTCRACGYDLCGTTSVDCPECGALRELGAKRVRALDRANA